MFLHSSRGKIYPNFDKIYSRYSICFCMGSKTHMVFYCSTLMVRILFRHNKLKILGLMAMPCIWLYTSKVMVLTTSSVCLIFVKIDRLSLNLGLHQISLSNFEHLFACMLLCFTPALKQFNIYILLEPKFQDSCHPRSGYDWNNVGCYCNGELSEAI